MCHGRHRHLANHLLLSSRKIDVTGPADADKGIIVIFDIFGFFDQTVQGADILATSDDHQKYRVLMPDCKALLTASNSPIQTVVIYTWRQRTSRGYIFAWFRFR